MASHRVQKPLKVGKVDDYSITIDLDWLNGDEITSATATSDTAKVTAGAVTIVDNKIFVALTGVEATNATDVHFDYTTATRSDCDYITITVEDC